MGWLTRKLTLVTVGSIPAIHRVGGLYSSLIAVSAKSSPKERPVTRHRIFLAVISIGVSFPCQIGRGLKSPPSARTAVYK